MYVHMYEHPYYMVFGGTETQIPINKMVICVIDNEIRTRHVTDFNYFRFEINDDSAHCVTIDKIMRVIYIHVE